jgi:glutamyl-tRNA reductase
MTGEVLPEALQELSLQPGVNEAMIVSTFNRVELFVSYGEHQPNLLKILGLRDPAAKAVLMFP